ncbi:MAG: amino acid permease, partial [Rhodanobacteraceae bacterium]
MTLAKTLRTFDLVLFNVAAIVGLRWVALTAHSGPSSLALWVLAALAFFIPQGLCVMTLSSAMPREGGLYVWVSEAFGERHGFIAGWLYWSSNILYFPTLTLSTVVFALYIFNLRFAALENSAAYTASASLLLLIVALWLNIIGMKSGRWVQNLGGLAQWIPAIVAVAVGVIALIESGSATPMPAASFVPSFAKLDTVIFFSQMC